MRDPMQHAAIARRMDEADFCALGDLAVIVPP